MSDAFMHARMHETSRVRASFSLHSLSRRRPSSFVVIVRRPPVRRRVERRENVLGGASRRRRHPRVGLDERARDGGADVPVPTEHDDATHRRGHVLRSTTRFADDEDGRAQERRRDGWRTGRGFVFTRSDELYLDSGEPQT